MPFEKLSDDRKGEGSVEIRKRVTKACALQTERFKDLEKVQYNTQINTKQIREYFRLNQASLELLKTPWSG